MVDLFEPRTATATARSTSRCSFSGTSLKLAYRVVAYVREKRRQSGWVETFCRKKPSGEPSGVGVLGMSASVSTIGDGDGVGGAGPACRCVAVVVISALLRVLRVLYVVHRKTVAVAAEESLE